ncbi:MAG TPA: hypothetical protein VFX51_24810 [Solirubrobacteraceae bacterium]|nr:hypothetical protein [Solirubrobacteraceae bacterium]
MHPEFEAIVARFDGEPDIEQGTGFGQSPGLRVRRKIFAMLVDGELVVKLPADRCAELVAAGRGRLFRSGAREMREWVVVGDEHADEWLGLAEAAHAFVGG